MQTRKEENDYYLWKIRNLMVVIHSYLEKKNYNTLKFHLNNSPLL